jgi:hypothetical protein
MSRVSKAALRVGGALAVLAVLAALTLAVWLETGFWLPVLDQTALETIKTESHALMLAQPTKTYVTIPKDRWPAAISALKPELVTVFSSDVDILIEPFFDGGWGYTVMRNEREQPEPKGRFLKLGPGIYWHRPY